MSMRKVRDLLQGTGVDVPSKWTPYQQQQWAAQVDVILQAAAELENTAADASHTRKKKRHTRGVRKATTSSDTTTATSRPSRPSRQAKAQAIVKLRNFSKGLSNLHTEDGKFDGVSYVTRGKGNTS